MQQFGVTLMMKISLADGTPVPVLGQGTWKMGEGERPAKEEVAALRLGIDLGMTLIDTAEMYGDGRAEEVVGQAIAGQRERVILVTKVYLRNASRKGLPVACERSLRRLGTDTTLQSRRTPASFVDAGQLHSTQLQTSQARTNFLLGSKKRIPSPLSTSHPTAFRTQQELRSGALYKEKSV